MSEFMKRVGFGDLHVGIKEEVIPNTTPLKETNNILRPPILDTTKPYYVGFSNINLVLNPDGGKSLQEEYDSGQRASAYVGGKNGVPYIPYTPESPTPEHVELLRVLHMIYPDPDMFDYVLRLFASCLEGTNRHKLFAIFKGEGNGILFILKLLTRTFGDYASYDGCSSVAYNDQQTLRKAEGKRIIRLNEPQEGYTISTTRIKQLTDSDIFIDKKGSFHITCVPIMECAELPPLRNAPASIWDRIRVIPHIVTFGDDSLLNLSNSTIERLYPFFASLLVWYYENRYVNDGLVEAPQVTYATNAYKDENMDPFERFCKESIICEDGAVSMEKDILFSYKRWLQYYPGCAPISRHKILCRMAEVYGNSTEGKFVGIRIKEDI